MAKKSLLIIMERLSLALSLGMAVPLATKAMVSISHPPSLVNSSEPTTAAQERFRASLVSFLAAFLLNLDMNTYVSCTICRGNHNQPALGHKG